MAGEHELLLRIGADIRQYEAGLRRVEAGAKTLKQRVAGFNRDAGAKIGAGLGRLASPFTALLGGAVILKATHDIVKFDSALTRMAIQGNMSAEEQMKLRDTIMDTTMATGQSRESLLGGLDAIVERTGDLAFARTIMKDMAIASTATGASMGDLGALAANLRDKMGLAKGEIMGAFDVLTTQGKAGAFTLENMATMGERLFAAAGRFGVKGMGGIKEFGALVQMARMGTGSSEQATTAIEGAMADIIDKAEMLKASGFSIFKPGTKNEIKSVSEVFKGIIKMTGGDVTKLQKIFGRESIRGVTAIADAYKKTGGFDLFDKLTKGGAPTMMKDYARYTASAAYQFSLLRNAAVLFADSALSPLIGNVAEKIRSLTNDPAAMERFIGQIKALGSEIGSLLDFLMQVAENPAFKWFVANPIRALGAYAEYNEASSEAAARTQTVAHQRKATWSTLDEAQRRDIQGKMKEDPTYFAKTLDRIAAQRALETKWMQHDIHMSHEIRQDGTVVSRVEGDSSGIAVTSSTKRGNLAYVP